MAASPSLIAYRVLFVTLGCVMLATLIYTLLTDGSPFRRELLTPWMSATLIDFYINVVAIAVWVVYKETTWISTILWVLMLVCFGSITTCAYIAKKLFDISSQDPTEDPLNHVLLRNCAERKMKCSCVILGRIIFSVLSVTMLAIVIYTVATDGLPFRRELLTPWMAATLIDFYINIVAILVWIVHKESTWIGACLWVCLLICFGSIATGAYIAIQLFQLSCQEPMYHVLLDPHKNGWSASSKNASA